VVNIDSRVFLYLRIVLVSILIAFLGLGPVPHALSTLLQNAHLALDSGEWSSAAISLAKIAEYYPWRIELNIDAAHAAFNAGDAKATIEYLERPGTLSRLSVDDLILLGEAYYNNGNASKAESIWKGIAAHGDSIQAVQRLADLYLEQKDFVSAAGQKQTLLSLNPSDVKLYYQVGLLSAITDPLKALPFLAQAVEIDPSAATNAQNLYDKIRTASLFDQPAYTLLATGRQLADSGEWVYAAEAFKHATELDPGYADAWAFLGEAQQQINIQETGSSSETGINELDQALQLDRGSVLANTFMGLYWERQQDYSQAQSYLEQAIANSPDDPYLYTELGNILSKAGDLPAAQLAFEKAIQLAPQDPMFYRLKAEFALENQIQTRELALTAARQALMLNPNDPQSLDLMANVMLELEDYYSAESYAQAAINADPDYTPAYLHLGTAYLYRGESDLARKWLDQTIKKEPGSWAAAQAARMIDYYFP
jgi:tetratricopeptide (TPR) repeat protein